MKMSQLSGLALAVAAAAAASPAQADPPNGAASVDATPMRGPFPSLEAICKADGADDADLKSCVDPAKAAPCHFTGSKMAGAFSESRVLRGCEIALHAPSGWYVLASAPAWTNFLNNGDRYVSELSSIAASKDGKAALVRGVFVHWTAPAKMPWLEHPAFDEWYECEERLFVCAAGAGGPSCAGPFAITYTTYCRNSEHPERALHTAEAHDFHFDVALAGTTLTFKAPAAQPRTAPLPGWAVVALGAAETKDQRRELSPERVELHFP